MLGCFRQGESRAFASRARLGYCRAGVCRKLSELGFFGSPWRRRSWGNPWNFGQGTSGGLAVAKEIVGHNLVKGVQHPNLFGADLLDPIFPGGSFYYTREGIWDVHKSD